MVSKIRRLCELLYKSMIITYGSPEMMSGRPRFGELVQRFTFLQLKATLKKNLGKCQKMDNEIEIKVDPWCLTDTLTEFKSESEDVHDSTKCGDVGNRVQIKEEPAEECLVPPQTVSWNSEAGRPNIKMEIKEEPLWLDTSSTDIDDEKKKTVSETEEILGLVSSVEETSRLCTEQTCRNSNDDNEGISNNTGTFAFVNCAQQHVQDTKTNNIATSDVKIYNLSENCKGDIGEDSSSRFELQDVNKKGKILHKCDICGKSLSTLSKLKVHKSIHDDKRPHKCEMCTKSFRQLAHLIRHHGTHENKKAYKCEICGAAFSNISYLKFHNLIHEGKAANRCEICDKSFVTPSNLNKHKLIHRDKKLHKCEVCGKSFITSSYLKEHKLIHEGKKSHKCKVCDKAFLKLSDLKVHNLIHEGIKPHKCEICQKSFVTTSNLKVHKLFHEGNRPHKCDKCEKTYILLSDLKRHKLSHDSKRPQKPYKCDICEKSYASASSLKVHKLYHVGNRPHQCDKCEKNFILLSDLKRHKLTHEGKKAHKCEICEETFTYLSDLRQHESVH